MNTLRLSTLLACLFGSALLQAQTLTVHSDNRSKQTVYVKLLDKDEYPLAYDATAAKTIGLTSADSQEVTHFLISLPSETDPGECKILTRMKDGKMIADMEYNDPPLLCMLPNGASEVSLSPNDKGVYDLNVMVTVS